MTQAKATPFRVAIVGGGISGLFTALCLHHYCPSGRIQVDIYEQAAQYKEIGAGVGLGINAARLIHRIGLGEQLNAMAGKKHNVWLSFRRFDDGAEIITIMGNDDGEVKQAPVSRAEFLDMLYSTVLERNAAKLHTMKACRGVKDLGCEMMIEFEDGTSAVANLVIGCDGIHSKVRSTFVTDHHRYSGVIAYRGLIPIQALKEFWPLSTYSAVWLGKDKHFLVFPVSNNKNLNIVAFVKTDEGDLGELKESWTAIGTKEDMKNDFKSFDKTVQKMMDLMPDKPSKWLINDREPLGCWIYAHGKAVLLGDAAHAMCPHQGQNNASLNFLTHLKYSLGAGAGQAIEDGHLLGRTISDYLESDRTLAEWTNLYQSVRLPRAQKVQKTSLQCGEVYQMRAEGMVDKSFDECLPEVKARLKDRMRWIWTDDLDHQYEDMRQKRGLEIS